LYYRRHKNYPNFVFSNFCLANFELLTLFRFFLWRGANLFQKSFVHLLRVIKRFVPLRPLRKRGGWLSGGGVDKVLGMCENFSCKKFGGG
jgi:hypothetical protein